MTEQTALSMIRDDDGGMYARAEDITALLRRLGSSWKQLTEQGLTDLDPESVEALADALDDLADQIDVECIAARTTAAHTRGSEGDE